MNRIRFVTANDLIALMVYGDPFAYRRAVESEDQINNRDSRDPNQAPKPDKGDRYILAAAFIGIIIGGTAGFLIARYGFGIHAVFLGVIAGVFVGGIAGAYTGSWLKRKNMRNSEKNSIT